MAEIGAGGLVSRRRIAEARDQAFEPALLQAFGFELELFHHVAEALVQREVADARLEAASERAQRFDDLGAPRRYRRVEPHHLIAAQRASLVGGEQQKQQEIDVDVRLVLERETGVA